MKTRKLIIALTLFTGLLTACSGEKKTENKIETEVKIESEIKTEVNTTSVEDNVEKAEIRRLDSLRQVKEHGHAH